MPNLPAGRQVPNGLIEKGSQAAQLGVKKNPPLTVQQEGNSDYHIHVLKNLKKAYHHSPLSKSDV